MASKTVRVTQTRSAIGRLGSQRKTPVKAEWRPAGAFEE